MAALMGLVVVAVAAIGWGIRRAHRHAPAVSAEAVRAATAAAAAARTDRRPAVRVASHPVGTGEHAVRRNLPSTPPQTRPVLLPTPEPEPEPGGRHRVDNALTGALDAAAVRAAMDEGRLDLTDLPRMPP